jgi:hypothetical protein
MLLRIFVLISQILYNIMAKSNTKQTSAKVATKASEILRNPKSSAAEKSVAASDLAQTRKK